MELAVAAVVRRACHDSPSEPVEAVVQQLATRLRVRQLLRLHRDNLMLVLYLLLAQGGSRCEIQCTIDRMPSRLTKRAARTLARCVSIARPDAQPQVYAVVCRHPQFATDMFLKRASHRDPEAVFYLQAAVATATTPEVVHACLLDPQLCRVYRLLARN